jgi:hypothetical protein
MALPARSRKLWDDATAREFNIGVQAGADTHAFELRVTPPTLRCVAEVGGAVVITVYGGDGREGARPGVAEPPLGQV